MGFDLSTVKKVDPKDFDRTYGGKGYFRYSSGVTALQMIGVPNVLSKRLRYDFDEDGNELPPQLGCECGMYQAMSMNNMLQITPEECLMIASKMTNESFDKYVLGKPNSEAHFFKQLGTIVPDSALFYDDSDRQFFLDYSKYCAMAAKYGGFFVC